MGDAIAHGVYEFSAVGLRGDLQPLTQYEGKVLLIVNVASRCAFTAQYKALESLYKRYVERGLVVLGFPCNQFGGQEPGTEQEIGEFCERKYGVTFPLFAKVDVNGPGAHPLFEYLKAEKPGWMGLVGRSSIRWNFTKFLVDRHGRVRGRFAPGSSPARLAPKIETLLGER